MSFEGGAIVNEEPPEGSSDSSAPQIKTIDAPVQFRKGADFKVVLISDFDQPDDVDKALVLWSLPLFLVLLLGVLRRNRFLDREL